MIYFDRIDVTEGIDVKKTSASNECDICHYWYFSNYSFKFQPNVCNSCHNLLRISMKLSVVAILYIKGSGYYFIIRLISKNGYKLNAKSWFDRKNSNIIKCKNLLPYTKMGREILMLGDI